MGTVSSKPKADRLFEGVEIYLDKHISGLRNIMCKICRKESIAYLSSLKKCGMPILPAIYWTTMSEIQKGELGWKFCLFRFQVLWP